MGVWLFFILSSFLLSFQIFLVDWKKLKSLSYWSGYLVARSFRVVPLYVITLLFAYAITRSGIWHEGEGLPNTVIGSQLFEALSFQNAPGIFWTIPVELRS